MDITKIKNPWLKKWVEAIDKSKHPEIKCVPNTIQLAGQVSDQKNQVEPVADLLNNVIDSKLPQEISSAERNIQPFLAVPPKKSKHKEKLCNICGKEKTNCSRKKYKKWCDECYNNRHEILSRMGKIAANKQLEKQLKKQARKQARKDAQKNIANRECSICHIVKFLQQFNIMRGGIYDDVCLTCFNANRKIHGKHFKKVLKAKKKNNRIVLSIKAKTINDTTIVLPENGDTYKSRDNILKQIGFNTYKAYLKGALWRNIKKQVFQVKGDKCTLCDKSADCVHHRKYDKATLLGETLDWLVPICDDCHHKIEFMPKGEKTTHRKSEMLFEKLLKEKQSTNHQIGWV